MKIINKLLLSVLFGSLLLTSNSYAFSVDPVIRGCKDPRFRSFEPPRRKKGEPVPEVEPESEIAFTVSNNADLETIVVHAKNIKLNPTIVDKNSFIQVTARLPKELTGKFARIHLRAKSKDRECKSQDGWLLKIKKAATVETPEEPDNTTETIENSSTEPDKVLEAEVKPTPKKPE